MSDYTHALLIVFALCVTVLYYFSDDTDYE